MLHSKVSELRPQQQGIRSTSDIRPLACISSVKELRSSEKDSFHPFRSLHPLVYLWRTNKINRMTCGILDERTTAYTVKIVTVNRWCENYSKDTFILAVIASLIYPFSTQYFAARRCVTHLFPEWQAGLTEDIQIFQRVKIVGVCIFDATLLCWAISCAVGSLSTNLWVFILFVLLTALHQWFPQPQHTCYPYHSLLHKTYYYVWNTGEHE